MAVACEDTYQLLFVSAIGTKCRGPSFSVLAWANERSFRAKKMSEVAPALLSDYQRRRLRATNSARIYRVKLSRGYVRVAEMMDGEEGGQGRHAREKKDAALQTRSTLERGETMKKRK